jgi:prepilin-type N-terminal cleavage/methylation domain-containing protein
MAEGFTLIEVLVVIAVIVIIFSFGALIDLSAINRENLLSSQETLVSLLQKARSRAMNNIGTPPHTLEISADKFLLDDDEEIKRNEAITITEDGDSTFEVEFDQLSGNSEDLEILLTDSAGNTKSVSIKKNGLIVW